MQELAVLWIFALVKIQLEKMGLDRFIEMVYICVYEY